MRTHKPFLVSSKHFPISWKLYENENFSAQNEEKQKCTWEIIFLKIAILKQKHMDQLFTSACINLFSADIYTYKLSTK